MVFNFLCKISFRRKTSISSLCWLLRQGTGSIFLSYWTAKAQKNLHPFALDDLPFYCVSATPPTGNLKKLSSSVVVCRFYSKNRFTIHTKIKSSIHTQVVPPCTPRRFKELERASFTQCFSSFDLKRGLKELL